MCLDGSANPSAVLPDCTAMETPKGECALEFVCGRVLSAQMSSTAWKVLCMITDAEMRSHVLWRSLSRSDQETLLTASEHTPSHRSGQQHLLWAPTSSLLRATGCTKAHAGICFHTL